MTTEEATPEALAAGPPIDDARTQVPKNMRKRLASIGKYDAYLEVCDKSRLLAPFEMRQALDPEAIRTAIEARMTRSLTVLEGFRNTLVVLPLMLTWFSLALAALAYQQSISLPAKNGSAVASESFFQQWQEGFPLLQSVTLGSWHISLTILSTRFTFSEVAFLDVVILLLLLLLTAIIHIVEGRALRVSANVAKWVDGKLFEFTSNSMTWTLDPNAPEKPRWAAALEQIIYQQMDSVGTVQTTAAQLSEIYQQVHDIYRALDATLPTFKEQVEAMSNSQQFSAEEWQRMVEKLQIAILSIARVGDLLDPSGPSQHLTQRAFRAGLRSRPGQNGAGKSLLTRILGWFRRS